MKRVTIACLLCFALPALAVSNSFQWVGLYGYVQKTTDTNWCDSANWSNVTTSTYNDGYPDAIGDVAHFHLTNALDYVVLASNVTIGGFTNNATRVASGPPWQEEMYVKEISDDGSGSVITMDNGTNRAFWTYYDETAYYRDPSGQEISIPLHINGDFRYWWKTQRNRTYGGKISGTGDVWLVWQTDDSSDDWTLSGANNSFVGDLHLSQTNDKENAFIISADDYLPNGDLYTYHNGTSTTNTVTITSSGGAEDRLSDSCSVYLTNSVKLELKSGVTETINQLYINGVRQYFGTWGSTSSAADNKNDTYFEGTGVLTVLNGTVLAYRVRSLNGRWLLRLRAE